MRDRAGGGDMTAIIASTVPSAIVALCTIVGTVVGVVLCVQKIEEWKSKSVRIEL